MTPEQIEKKLKSLERKICCKSPQVLTGLQAEAISSPKQGVIVYIDTGNGVTINSTGWWGWTGSAWTKLN